MLNKYKVTFIDCGDTVEAFLYAQSEQSAKRQFINMVSKWDRPIEILSCEETDWE